MPGEIISKGSGLHRLSPALDTLPHCEHMNFGLQASLLISACLRCSAKAHICRSWSAVVQAFVSMLGSLFFSEAFSQSAGKNDFSCFNNSIYGNYPTRLKGIGRFCQVRSFPAGLPEPIKKAPRVRGFLSAAVSGLTA
jgi:hypothetical protein